VLRLQRQSLHNESELLSIGFSGQISCLGTALPAKAAEFILLPFYHSPLSFVQGDSMQTFNKYFPRSSFGRDVNSFPAWFRGLGRPISGFDISPLPAKTNFFAVGIPRVNLSTP
jgi:hypothetical protein